MRTLLLKLTMCMVAAAEVLQLTVETDSGSVVGEPPAAAFSLETSLGTHEIKWRDVKLASVRDGVIAATLHDGTKLSGRLPGGKISITGWNGEANTVDLTQARAIYVAILDRAPVQAPKLRQLPLLATGPVKARLVHLALGAEGKTILTLDTAARTLLSLNSVDLKQMGSILLPGTPSCFAGTGDPSRRLVGGDSYVSVVDLTSSKVEITVKLPRPCLQVASISDTEVLIITSEEILAVSLPTGVTVEKTRWTGSWAPLTRSESGTFYTGGGMIYWEPEAPNGFRLRTVSSVPSNSLGGAVFSADSRFAVTPSGHVYRTAKCYVADPAEVAQISPNRTACFLSADRLLSVDASHRFAIYETKGWKQISSGLLPEGTWWILSLDGGKSIAVICSADREWNVLASYYNYLAHPRALGSLVKLSLEE